MRRREFMGSVLGAIAAATGAKVLFVEPKGDGEIKGSEIHDWTQDELSPYDGYAEEMMLEDVVYLNGELTSVYDAYDAKGFREDISDLITNIEPHDSPLGTLLVKNRGKR